MVKLPLDCHRHALGGPTQGSVVEMHVAVGGRGAPMSEQAPGDMQAFAVLDRVRGVAVATMS